MLEIKKSHNTPFQEFLYNNLGNDPVAELVRNETPYKVYWRILFHQAEIRRRLQSDQGQNASHGQTCSTIELLVFD